LSCRDGAGEAGVNYSSKVPPNHPPTGLSEATPDEYVATLHPTAYRRFVKILRNTRALEFSARTLKLSGRYYDHSVVSNSLSIMVGSSVTTSGAPKGKEPSNRDLMNTLKSIQKQLTTSGNS